MAAFRWSKAALSPFQESSAGFAGRTTFNSSQKLILSVGGKHGSIWQDWVFNPVLEGFFDPLKHSKMLAEAEDHLAIFPFQECPSC